MDRAKNDLLGRQACVHPSVLTYTALYRQPCCWQHAATNHPRLPRPRAYPRGFGFSVKAVHEEHLAGPARRDLRFKVQSDSTASLVQQFDNLPLGDLWEDANLLEPIRYALTCKRTR